MEMRRRERKDNVKQCGGKNKRERGKENICLARNNLLEFYFTCYEHKDTLCNVKIID